VSRPDPSASRLQKEAVVSLSSQNVVDIAQLRADLKGQVIAPEDAGYDDARAVFVGTVDRHPLAIVRAADHDDVATVVSHARETGIELAVRSGGHSSSGHGTSEGGIVLDLADMQALDVDVEGRTAWAQTGLTCGAYTNAVAEHGLTTGFGDTGSVGVGGLTLGGGVGYFVRKHGLTIDNLLAADVVTADGRLVRTDADSHPDLFWAIRGGGGNFGVATRFRYRLQEVDTVVGGMLLLPATPEVIESFIAEAEAAPEELSTIANVMPTPPMPFVPTERHGELAVMALMVFAGPVEDGERAVAPFRALAEPIADMLRPMPYPEIYPPDDPAFHPVFVDRNLFVDGIDRAAAQTIVDHLEASNASMRVAQLRVLGGASARVPADATAYAHRTRRIMVNLAALYEQPEERPAHEAWIGDFAAALDQGVPGAYVNFISDDREARVRDAYPGATWERLAEVKRRYDPTNVFRVNPNIPPARA
jgi:FAD/FMN-containing dehydrogenase